MERERERGVGVELEHLTSQALGGQPLSLVFGAATNISFTAIYVYKCLFIYMHSESEIEREGESCVNPNPFECVSVGVGGVVLCVTC